MRYAYLIDPFARRVERVGLSSPVSSAEELHEIYALFDCDTIEAVAPFTARGDLMMVDENGKINGKTQEYFFCRLWPHDPIAGKALWVGRNAEGDIANPRTPLDYVLAHIVWTATSHGDRS